MFTQSFLDVDALRDTVEIVVQKTDTTDKDELEIAEF